LITLAIDTAEKRGSVAVVRDRECMAAEKHVWGIDYSAWLLPAAGRVLDAAQARMEQLDLLAGATGPGSFTGLRVGLTTVKAWAEVYRKAVVGVSRLEAIARSVASIEPMIAATYDAHRGQLFGALYRQQGGQLLQIGDELVIGPEDFVSLVDREAERQSVHWVCLDHELIQNNAILQKRLQQGDQLVFCSDELASTIGILGEERAAMGRLTDPLELDANYVRRSDAELFWRDTPSRVR
jgi:tRNA threonylcarbamoyladenosine biosynthesis protein TsaB